MLNRLAIFGVLLVVFCADGSAEQIQAKGNSQKPSAPIAAIPKQQDNGAALNGEKQDDIHADVKIVNPPQKDFYDKAPIWTNLVLVIVALGTGIVIGWQAWETRKAARGAQKAADAAFLNAQAVINAERARLLFEVEKEMDRKMHGIAIFTIYAVNHGRTPAEFVRIKGPVETVCGDIYDLPIPMKTHPSKLPDKWHIMPNEKCFIARFVPASMTIQALELAQAGGVSINEQERVIYGDVMYRDGISGEIRYSRYCFRFNREPFSNIGGSIEPAGPSEFNQKT